VRGDVGEQVLDVRTPDPLDREIGERREARRESSAARIVFGRGRRRPAAPIANRSRHAWATSPNRSGAVW
jgi:hypothetical protein